MTTTLLHILYGFRDAKMGARSGKCVSAGFELRSFEHQSETDAIRRMFLVHKFEILKM